MPPTPGPHVYLLVECVVYDANSGIQHKLNSTLGVDILDEDDNPPKAQLLSREIKCQFKVVSCLDMKKKKKYSSRLIGSCANEQRVEKCQNVKLNQRRIVEVIEPLFISRERRVRRVKSAFHSL